MTIRSRPGLARPLAAWRALRDCGALIALAALLAGCGAAGAPASATTAALDFVTVTVTPATVTVAAGGVPVDFTASVANGASSGVTWQVDGVVGGNATAGTISVSGQYLSPGTLPSPATVTITAISVADATRSASATVTLTAPSQVPTAQVTISPTSATAQAGLGLVPFTATVTNATSSAITWQVNGLSGGNATVGTISASGVYIAPFNVPSPSAVTVSAVLTANPTQSATATVTVTAPVMVTVLPASANVRAGVATQAFAATVSNAVSGAVTWEVNGVAGGNSTVGTITTWGLYTAPALAPSPATVTVSAMSNVDPTRSASVPVTIVPTASIAVTISPASASVQTGLGSQAFTATVSNTSSTSVSWQVNGVSGGNATVGTISSTGLYQAPQNQPTPAAVTVTAVLVSDPSYSGAAPVTITPPVTVVVSPASVTVAAGTGTQAFTATVSYTSNTAVTWKVNGIGGGNTTIGTISATGLYTAPTNVPTPAVVSVSALATADPTRSGSAAVTIAPVTVTVSPSNGTVQAGTGTLQYSATVANTSNSAVTWQVNGITGGSSSVGTISSTGLYAAPAAVPSPATVTITAVSVADPTRSGTATLTITAAITVSVSPPTASVAAGGGSQAFTATVQNTPSNGVSWQVNGVSGGNATLGTISAAGLYTAPATVPTPATVTVKAVSTADPTRSGSATVTITAAGTVSISISPSIATVTAGSGTQAFTAQVANGATGAVTWKVNGIVGGNTTVGTVSAGGLYTAPAAPPSPATVSVTAVSVDDPTKSASASVTVAAKAGPPTITGTPQTSAHVGQSYSFQPSATSPSGATLTFQIANKPSWATFNASSGLLSGTPASANIGTYANITISVTDGTNSASLPAYTITVLAGVTGAATLSWTAPTTRTDGSALTNLAGYHLYYGTTPGSYPNVITVANPGLATYVVSNLPAGTYYFVATAFDANGVESAYSNTGSKTIGD